MFADTTAVASPGSVLRTRRCMSRRSACTAVLGMGRGASRVWVRVRVGVSGPGPEVALLQCCRSACVVGSGRAVAPPPEKGFEGGRHRQHIPPRRTLGHTHVHALHHPTAAATQAHSRTHPGMMRHTRSPQTHQVPHVDAVPASAVHHQQPPLRILGEVEQHRADGQRVRLLGHKHLRPEQLGMLEDHV